MASAGERDPRHHVQNMKKALTDLRAHMREDIDKVDDPHFKALFETSAEVLGALIKAFEDYEAENEPAWQT